MIHYDADFVFESHTNIVKNSARARDTVVNQITLSDSAPRAMWEVVMFSNLDPWELVGVQQSKNHESGFQLQNSDASAVVAVVKWLNVARKGIGPIRVYAGRRHNFNGYKF